MPGLQTYIFVKKKDTQSNLPTYPKMSFNAAIAFSTAAASTSR